MQWPIRLALFGVLVTTGCQSASDFPPIRTESFIDLNKFAGDWFVIANIPTFIETKAYNAVESYAPPKDGKVETTFTFNQDGFEGKDKVYTPTAFVKEDTGNAVWGMQFIWPIKAEYRVVYVDADYQHTIIGRSKRDYVWLMAREPIITDAEFQRLSNIVEEEGYDMSKLRLVPQKSI